MSLSIDRTLRWLSWSLSALCLGTIAAGYRSPLLFLVIVFHGMIAAADCLLHWQRNERSPADKNCRTFWRWRDRLCPDEFPSRRVMLRYDKRALDPAQASSLVWICEQTIDNLARWQGGLLIVRPTVFLLANSEQFRQVIGAHCGAICILDKSAVVLPAYGVPGHGYVDDVIRHEFAHLFTAEWNRHALPLLNEGFATWWQQAGARSGIGQRLLSIDSKSSLIDLLDPGAFYNKTRVATNYVLAGSFSGFLIGRFGREAYRGFYQRATRANFERCLADCFGLTLGEIEARWRIETTAAQMLRSKLRREIGGDIEVAV